MPVKSKNYTVLTAETVDGLEDKVRDFANSWYVPVGGVSVSTSTVQWENERKGYMETEYVTIFAQAVHHEVEV